MKQQPTNLFYRQLDLLIIMARASMAPAQDPLAIACQTMLQAPYVVHGTVTIKLTKWFGNILGDVVKVEHYDPASK